MKSGIYIIISPSAKVYIGQAVDLDRRIKSYSIRIDRRQHKIYNSVKKYGIENHLIEVIEECPIEQLNERERYWQDEYDVLGEYGLNCRLTEVGDKSGRLSVETKQKMAANAKALWSDERAKKMRAAQKYLPFTDERRKNISDAMKASIARRKNKQTVNE